MTDDSKTALGKIIYSFFSGALLGAGLALLFTPVSGREARHAISNEFDDLKEKLVQFEEKLQKNSASLAAEFPEENFI